MITHLKPLITYHGPLELIEDTEGGVRHLELKGNTYLDRGEVMNLKDRLGDWLGAPHDAMGGIELDSDERAFIAVCIGGCNHIGRVAEFQKPIAESVLAKLDDHPPTLTLEHATELIAKMQGRRLKLKPEIRQPLYIPPKGGPFEHAVGTLSLTPNVAGDVIASRWNGATWDMLGVVEIGPEDTLQDIIDMLKGNGFAPVEEEKKDDPKPTRDPEGDDG